jgi:hypothetical protein
MEQETQVILSELIKVISRPDWWTIGITVVNAAIMVWLGWRQYKLQQQQTELQKRQTEAQEYEIYRRLYLLVNNANNEIDEFLKNLYMGTWQPHIQMDKDYLLRKQKYIEQLRKDLSENYWDYKLKFSQESFNVDGYHNILSQMFYVLQQFNESMTKGEVNIAQGCQQFTCERGKEDEAYAFIIASRFKTMDLKDMIMGGLMNFAEQKRELSGFEKFVSEIEMKCKIV